MDHRAPCAWLHVFLHGKCPEKKTKNHYECRRAPAAMCRSSSLPAIKYCAEHSASNILLTDGRRKTWPYRGWQRRRVINRNCTLQMYLEVEQIIECCTLDTRMRTIRFLFYIFFCQFISASKINLILHSSHAHTQTARNMNNYILKRNSVLRWIEGVYHKHEGDDDVFLVFLFYFFVLWLSNIWNYADLFTVHIQLIE